MLDSVSIVNSLTTDVGSVLAVVLVAIVGLLAALIGLGMGIRYFKRWIGWKDTGDHFGGFSVQRRWRNNNWDIRFKK